MGLCRLVDGRPEKHVTLEGIKLDVVEPFQYLADKICPGGGYELAKIVRTRVSWEKFHELLPLLTSTRIYFTKRGKLYDSCVRGTLLDASKCLTL